MSTNGRSTESFIPALVAPIVERLRELRDAKSGLPISSHRPGLTGLLLVKGKASFRKVFQPFLNEALQKQSLFNEQVVELAQAIYRDMKTLENAALGMRIGLDARLKRVEDALARFESLEKKLSATERPSSSRVNPVATTKVNGTTDAH